jgi:hypothetical protein
MLIQEQQQNEDVGDQATREHVLPCDGNTVWEQLDNQQLAII